MPKVKEFKISLCTVVMNRLHHIKKTLPKNIKDNLAYGNVEFVVMDYNSKDGLETWIKKEMKEYIDAGILVYAKNTEASVFDRSHSRNQMFQVATGDIICNIDADNYTGKGFAEYVNTTFCKEDKILLVADTKGKYYNLKDAFGRFCTLRKDFLKVKGYDESMKSYGYEDIDLYSRIKLLGRKERVIKDVSYLKSIPHQNEERTKNEYINKNLYAFYIRYIDAWKSEVFFLYKDKSYDKGTLIPNRYKTNAAASIKQGKWEKGTWSKEKNELVLLLTGARKGEKFVGTERMGKLTEINSDAGLVYHKIKDPSFLSEVMITHSIITNLEKYQLNLKEKKIIVNPKSFGHGKVQINFKSRPTILR
ncbi:MAG: hypothetical protein JWM14_1075 [Chitinophagaceae bacterium]|nr:hypothetical protein [Chitinophagaceae bacterium]